MASEGSGDEAAFTDCVGSGSELRAETPASRRRQISVTEMVRRAESRKSKRPAPDRSSKSPRDPPLPAAKRALAEPAQPAETPAVELSAGALAAIRQLVDNGISSVIRAFENKVETIERRLSVLESEAMDRDHAVRQLEEQLATQTRLNADLQAQVESIDLNRRLSSLILTCDEFGQRKMNEDMEGKVVSLLNERIQGLSLTITDIHAAHRLQRDDKVIVKFARRSVRDRVFEARFHLAAYESTSARTGSGAIGRRRGPALFISESLTAHNQRIYNQLLQVRKTSNGTKVASVFSRRGLVYCRTVKNGPNIRVPDEAALRRIVGGAVEPSPSVSGRGGSTAGGGSALVGRGGDRSAAPAAGRSPAVPVTASRDPVPSRPAAEPAPASGTEPAGGAPAGQPAAPQSLSTLAGPPSAATSGAPSAVADVAPSVAAAAAGVLSAAPDEVSPAASDELSMTPAPASPADETSEVRSLAAVVAPSVSVSGPLEGAT